MESKNYLKNSVSEKQLKEVAGGKSSDVFKKSAASLMAALTMSASTGVSPLAAPVKPQKNESTSSFGTEETVVTAGGLAIALAALYGIKKGIDAHYNVDAHYNEPNKGNVHVITIEGDPTNFSRCFQAISRTKVGVEGEKRDLLDCKENYFFVVKSSSYSQQRIYAIVPASRKNLEPDYAGYLDYHSRWGLYNAKKGKHGEKKVVEYFGKIDNDVKIIASLENGKKSKKGIFYEMIKIDTEKEYENEKINEVRKSVLKIAKENGEYKNVAEVSSSSEKGESKNESGGMDGDTSVIPGVEDILYIGDYYDGFHLSQIARRALKEVSDKGRFFVFGEANCVDNFIFTYGKHKVWFVKKIEEEKFNEYKGELWNPDNGSEVEWVYDVKESYSTQPIVDIPKLSKRSFYGKPKINFCSGRYSQDLLDKRGEGDEHYYYAIVVVDEESCDFSQIRDRFNEQYPDPFQIYR